MKFDQLNNPDGIKALYEMALETLSDDTFLLLDGSLLDQPLESDLESHINTKDKPDIEGYTFHHTIGSGGMGTVWLATQHEPNRKVAIKIINPHLTSDIRAKFRFIREIKIAAKLKHNHIVRVLSSGTSNGHLYYAMDYIEGEHLNTYIKNNPNEQEFIKLIIAVCDAIHHAHSKGIIHRDIKPSNIIVDAQGQPYILDFGIASTFDDQSKLDVTITHHHELIGTMRYMSPEQASGDHSSVGTTSDIYAIGVLLYEGILGKHPYEDGTNFEIQKHIIEGEIIRPTLARQSISRDLESVILKAMSQLPDQRYQSANELGDDLSNYLNGDPVSAQKITLLYLLKKKIAKRPLQYLTTITAVIVFILLIAWSYQTIKFERDANLKLADRNAQENYAKSIVIAAKDVASGNHQSAYTTLQNADHSRKHIEFDILMKSVDQRLWNYNNNLGILTHPKLKYNPDKRIIQIAGIYKPLSSIPITNLDHPPNQIHTNSKLIFSRYSDDLKYAIRFNKEKKLNELYTVTDYQPILELKNYKGKYVHSFDISHDGKYLAISNQSSTMAYDITTGNSIPLPISDKPTFLKFLSHSHHLATLTTDITNQLSVIDLSISQLTMPPDNNFTHHKISTNHQSSHFVTWGEKGSNPVLWQFENNDIKQIHVIPISDALIKNIIFSQTKDYLIILSSDGSIKYYNYQLQTFGKTYRGGNTNEIYAAVEIMNTNHLLVATNLGIACFNLNRDDSIGHKIGSVSATGNEIKPVVFTQNNTIHAFIKPLKGLYLHDITNNTLNLLLDDVSINTYAIKSKSELYFTKFGDNNLILYHADFTNRSTPVIFTFQVLPDQFGIDDMCYIPEKNLVIMALINGTTVIYDPENRKILKQLKGNQWCRPLGNNKLLTLNRNQKNQLLIYNLNNYSKSTIQLSNSNPIDLILSNDKKFVSVIYSDYHYQLINLNTGQSLYTKQVDGNTRLQKMIFSADSSRLIIGGYHLSIIDTHTGIQLLDINAEKGYSFFPLHLNYSRNKKLQILLSGYRYDYP